MSLNKLNTCSEKQAQQLLMQCCTSSTWVEAMLENRPFANPEALFQAGSDHYWVLGETDFLEAFAGHPKIGDIDSLQKKYANTKTLASSEQSGVNTATEQTLQLLATANQAYEEKFGFIFIIYASGKSAVEILAQLQQRLLNDRDTELINAVVEQSKITRLRLEKFI